MSELEKYVADTLAPLIPAYEKLDVRANIGDNTYSVEFLQRLTERECNAMTWQITE